MNKTLYIYHKNGHWCKDMHGDKINSHGIKYEVDRFDHIEIKQDENWIKKLIQWNRYYKMQNGRKAAFITKVWLFDQPGKPREIIINKNWAKLMCFVLNLLPESIRRKRKLWFGL